MHMGLGDGILFYCLNLAALALERSGKHAKHA